MLKDLLNHGTPSQLHIVAVIASKQGVETLSNAFPDAHIWVGAIDENLTAKRLYFSRLEMLEICLMDKNYRDNHYESKAITKTLTLFLDFQNFPSNGAYCISRGENIVY